MKNRHILVVGIAILSVLRLAHSLQLLPPSSSGSSSSGSTRKDFLVSTIALTPFATLLSPTSSSSLPLTSASSLASRLASRDPGELRNQLFNIPPKAQIYPKWMNGEWNYNFQFNGYLFPSSNIPRAQLLQNPLIPGFQKCSIVAFADLGLPEVTFTRRFENRLEDRSLFFHSSIDAHLQQKYNASSSTKRPSLVRQVATTLTNPNRISIEFVPYKTINAERIELFCNARDDETTDGDTETFICSEHIRQVTFGTGSTPGVPRQVVSNYAHYWTYRQQDDHSTITGNILTAGYLDPQDPLYFQEPTKPVVVYSHQFRGEKVG